MCKSLLNFLNRKLLKENFSEDELKEKAKKLLKQIGKLNARYVKDYEEAVSSVTEDLKKEEED